MAVVVASSKNKTLDFPYIASGRMWSVILVALACVFGVTGCATYSSSFGVIKRDLVDQQYDAALREIEKQSGSKTDRALYLLNKGMVLRMKGAFVDSNQALEAAKNEMERLYAISVSQNALSFVVNDATVSYAGDDYEQVLVHLYMAFNYLQLSQPDDARVEALQVEEKLREIAEKIPENKFTDDAFARYLTGLIYEERGEWSDALISYRQAYRAYKKYQVNFSMPIPPMLGYDLIRLSEHEGMTDEATGYSKEFGINPQQASHSDNENGELVFVLNDGLVPIKREKFVNALDPVTLTMVHIALPYYAPRVNNAVTARISASGKTAATEMVENIDAIARKSLDTRMPAILARSVARSAARIATQIALENRNQNNGNSVAGPLGILFMDAVTIATERADTRSWLTLPANVQMARLNLPSGRYTIRLELLGINGEIISTREYPDVVIKQAHKTYLTEHWISTAVPH
jgi:hypothetical protein